MYCQSIKYYDNSHCIVQKKYFFPIKYFYSNIKYHYSNKNCDNKKSIIKSQKYFWLL